MRCVEACWACALHQYQRCSHGMSMAAGRNSRHSNADLSTEMVQALNNCCAGCLGEGGSASRGRSRQARRRRRRAVLL